MNPWAEKGLELYASGLDPSVLAYLRQVDSTAATLLVHADREMERAEQLTRRRSRREQAEAECAAAVVWEIRRMIRARRVDSA